MQSRKGILIQNSVSHSLKKKGISKEIKIVNKVKLHNSLIKNNSDLFADFIFTNLNDSIAQSAFPFLLRLANIAPVHKKEIKT